VKASARDHRGARNPNAVLTPRLVGEARRLHAAGFGYGFVARWLDVSKSCAQALLTGRTWKLRQDKKLVSLPRR